MMKKRRVYFFFSRVKMMIVNCQVIKEIRLPLSRAQQLFTRIDNLRVIYLVRDPRAIFHSHRKLEWQTTPKSLCGKLGSDYDQVVRLLHCQFRDRFTV